MSDGEAESGSRSADKGAGAAVAAGAVGRRGPRGLAGASTGNLALGVGVGMALGVASAR
ncbi:hypothetical protein NKH18_16065 [Streptomyces sp. M10(2022)]